MTIKEIKEVELECQRFLKRVKELKNRHKESGDYIFLTGCKETGALKRSAMDLKNELTKITNS